MNVVDTLAEALGSTRVRNRTGAEGPHAYASEAGDCIRRVALSILTDRAEDPVDLGSQITFRIGRDLEDAVIMAMVAQNPTCRTQVPWVNGLVSGLADGVYEEQGLKWVVEIKTCSLNTFKYVGRTGPKREHILQAALSALALGGDMLHIVYVCKGAPQGESPVYEYHIEVPYGEAQVALEALQYAVRAGMDKVIPEPMWNGSIIPTPDVKYGPCRWCNFQDICRAIGPQAQSFTSFEYAR